jgi:phosphoribosylpyrophosphate synthetase
MYGRVGMSLILEQLDRRLDTFLGVGDPTQDIDREALEGLQNSIHVFQKEKYHVIFHNSMEQFVDRLIEESNKKESKIQIQKYETEWNRFDDGDMDNIKIKGMTSPTHFKNKNILFVASFHNNDITLSQFHAIAFLCECLAQSLTILLPFYSTGTMERVDINNDGVIPTANTLALLFNGLPSVGRPIRVMTYDLHTLQNRFYFTGHAVATLHTAIPLIIGVIENSRRGPNPINAIAFPDAGAHKRYGNLFKDKIDENDMIICSKVREGGKRIVKIADGDAGGKHVLIVDDLTRSGETLVQCAETLKSATEKGGGAKCVSAYVTHFVPTKALHTDLSTSGPHKLSTFEKFYYTDSVPSERSYDETMHMLNLAELVLNDL